MEKNSRALLVSGLVVMLLLAFAMVAGFKESSVGIAAEKTASSLSVSGQGKVSTKPDMAYITCGVQTEAATARTAQSENNAKMAKVLSALKGIGIKEDDIRTNSYDLSPRYEYYEVKEGGQKQRLTGYVVTNQVQVTVRNINDVGKALDTVVSAGANLSGGVSFTLSGERMEKAYADALTDAIRNAGGKAGVMAKGLGITLGKPKEVNEGGGFMPPVYSRDVYTDAKAAGAGSVPISAGQLEVTASVSMRYEY